MPKDFLLFYTIVCYSLGRRDLKKKIKKCNKGQEGSKDVILHVTYSLNDNLDNLDISSGGIKCSVFRRTNK